MENDNVTEIEKPGLSLSSLKNLLSSDTNMSLCDADHQSKNDAESEKASESDASSVQPDWRDSQKYLQFMTRKPPLRVTKNEPLLGTYQKFLDTQSYDFRTSPIFSDVVRQHIITSHGRSPFSRNFEPFPQFGLLGMGDRPNKRGVLQRVHSNIDSKPGEDLIFTNMDAPWSTFICGSQGGGKSHTLSCLLENALLKSSPVNTMEEPLTGIVFHYDKFSGFMESQLCEAAFLCSHVKSVRVLVAPTSEQRMRRLYRDLPGLPENSPQPRVVPLYFQERHLDISLLMTLMAVSDNNNKRTPLYMEMIYKLLRQMAKENQDREGIDFREFERALSEMGFVAEQKTFLNMRMDLLRSFLDPRVTGDHSIVPPDFDSIWKFEPGTLTIVDLSDPFVSPDDACSLFSVCLSIFMAHCRNTGKIIALDEAHKFLTRSGEAMKFTEDLLQVIRQQRHLGARVLIATQEPTLSPKLLDLSNVSVIHRFSSPAWFNVLQDHLCGIKVAHTDQQEMFRRIVSLATGEALLFCPSAILDTTDEAIKPLKDSYTSVKIRKRVTADGGRDIMASEQRRNRSLPALMNEVTSGPFDFSKLPSTNPVFGSRPSSSSSQTLHGATEPIASSKPEVEFSVNGSASQAFHALANSLGGFPDSPPRNNSLELQPKTPSPTVKSESQAVHVTHVAPLAIPPNSTTRATSSKSVISATNQKLAFEPNKANQAKLRSAVREAVLSSLSAKPKSLALTWPEDYRKRCACILGVKSATFIRRDWINISKSAIKQGLAEFYRQRKIAPPAHQGFDWLRDMIKH